MKGVTRVVSPWPACLALLVLVAVGCSRPAPAWEAGNPIQPLPEGPLGTDIDLSALPDAPTPERIRLGRWLFYDRRLSADNTVSCASCHRPDHAFSEPTPVSTGIHGQSGARKAPTFVNQAVTLYPHFFWDGRAASLEEQALGPIQNPVEMGNTQEAMIETLTRVTGYRRYFLEAFGSTAITVRRVAQAIADYERTRMSGNSPWDRWRRARDEEAVSDEVKRGHELFFGQAGCNQCHLGNNFSDSLFHNVGIGWDPETETLSDEGRYAVTEHETDRGAFKTPTLREVTKRAPYMHDGSIATLREVVEHYNRGAIPNPHLDPKIEPLGLTDADIDALVALMHALEGEGYQDVPPVEFPQ